MLDALADIENTKDILREKFYSPAENLPYAVLRSKNLTAEIQTLRCKVTNLPSVSQGRLAPDDRNKFVFRTFQVTFMDHTVKGLYTYSKAADIEAAFARPVDDPVQPGLGIKVSVSIEGTLKYPYQMGGGCTGNEDEDQFRSVSNKYCRPQTFPDIVESRDCVCTIQNPPTGDQFIATQFEACTLPDEHPFAMNPDTGRQNENPLTANPIQGMGSNLIKITFNEVPTCVENATCDFPLMRAAWDTDPRQTVGDDTGENSPNNYVQEFRKGRQPYWVVYRTMDTVQTHDFTSATYTNTTTEGFYTITAEVTQEVRNTKTVNTTKLGNTPGLKWMEKEVVTWTKSTQVTKGFMGSLVFGGWDGATPRSDLWLYSYERQLDFKWSPILNESSPRGINRRCLEFHPTINCHVYNFENNPDLFDGTRALSITDKFKDGPFKGQPFRSYTLNAAEDNRLEPTSIPCDQEIPRTTSGYCLCNDGIARSVGCSHGTFNCRDECNCTATVTRDIEYGQFRSRPCGTFDSVQHPDFRSEKTRGRLPVANEWRKLSPKPDTKTTTGVPPARYGHSMVSYNKAPEDLKALPQEKAYRMLLFGGQGEDGYLGDLWSLEIPGYQQKQKYTPPPPVYYLDCVANEGFVTLDLNGTILYVAHNETIEAFRARLLDVSFIKNVTVQTSAVNHTTVCTLPNVARGVVKVSVAIRITDWSEDPRMAFAVPQIEIPFTTNGTNLNYWYEYNNGMNISRNASLARVYTRTVVPTAAEVKISNLDIGDVYWVRHHGTKKTRRRVQMYIIFYRLAYIQWPISVCRCEIFILVNEFRTGLHDTLTHTEYSMSVSTISTFQVHHPGRRWKPPRPSRRRPRRAKTT